MADAVGSSLDTKRADRSVWLVKVPAFVKKAWTDAAALPNAATEPPQIGTVRPTPTLRVGWFSAPSRVRHSRWCTRPRCA